MLVVTRLVKRKRTSTTLHDLTIIVITIIIIIIIIIIKPSNERLFFLQILSRVNLNMLRNRQFPEFAIVDGRQNPEVSAFVFQVKILVVRVFLTKRIARLSASAATATIAVRIPRSCHAGVEKAGLKDGKQVKTLAWM